MANNSEKLIDWILTTLIQTLDFLNLSLYKNIMEQSSEIKTSLKREYDLYSNAMGFYKSALKEF